LSVHKYSCVLSSHDFLTHKKDMLGTMKSDTEYLDMHVCQYESKLGHMNTQVEQEYISQIRKK
jgi:hypothetical protein